MQAAFSVAGEADAGAIFHAGGNFCVHRSLPQHPAFAFALGAGIGDHAAGALAGGTGARNAEETLLVADLSAAIAGTAGDGRFAWGRTRTSALFAGFVSPHRDFGFGAEDRVLEFHVDIFAQVSTALGAAAAARAPAENFSQAEEVAKNIAQVGGVKARACASAQAGVTEAVIDAALFDVRQHRVGLAALLEFLFRVGIVGIAVGMELQRQLAIGALDLLLGGGAGHAQNFVVVAFSVAGQNGLSSNPFRLSFSDHIVSVPGITRDSHHRRTEQAVFQLVAALKLVEHMMVLGLPSVHHFNRLVKMRIKRFTLRRNGTQSQFGQGILQLFVDEFHSAPKFRLVRSAGLQARARNCPGSAATPSGHR